MAVTPRMWWLDVAGSNHLMLAVEWCQGLPSARQKVRATHSSTHPWPAHVRAPIRELRKADENNLYFVAFHIDKLNGITAFGVGSKNHQKEDACSLAYQICAETIRVGRSPINAGRLAVDPDYTRDNYQPRGMQKEFTKFAVAEWQRDAGEVRGWFFADCSSAEHYFGQRKYGEHTIALIEGSAIKDLWGSNVGKKPIRAWWNSKKASETRRGPSQEDTLVFSTHPWIPKRISVVSIYCFWPRTINQRIEHLNVLKEALAQQTWAVIPSP